jgi:Ni,Fe-hydrogenase maturation factor
MPAPAIICIGNIARGDDGVGWRVAENPAAASFAMIALSS